MSQPIRLFGLSGSLRKGSFATAILKTLADEIAPQAQIIYGDIGSLPHYNQDLDGDVPPAAVAAMRAALVAAQGLVIVSPEYNHGMPGVLKNAIDWLSSPPSTAALIGKHALIITASPAFTGGVRAQAHLRESLISRTGAAHYNRRSGHPHGACQNRRWPPELIRSRSISLLKLCNNS